MYDEQTRINASISYLFLGPLFLLAKKDTPLAEKYVQDHAKRASLLILASIVLYGIFFAISDILYVSFFGISLASFVAGIIITAILGVLLHGAYYAFTGKEAAWVSLQNIFQQSSSWETQAAIDVSGYTDEEKIRIVASFLPFLGIYLSSRYDKAEILLGRKIWSFLTGSIILVSIFTTSIWLSVILSLLYIGIIVTTLVGLFVQKQFLQIGFYRYIPSYRESEAHIFSAIIFSCRFIWVIFWKNKDFSYQEIFSSILEDTRSSSQETEPYFMPLWVTGVPFLNLITLPSYWNPVYAKYRSLISQGLILTLLVVIVWYMYGWNSNIHTLLLFPIVHLISFANKDNNTLAPIISLITSFVHFIKQWRSKIQDTVESKEEKIRFSYGSTPEKAEEEIWNL